VHDKKKRATDVVFSIQSKRNVKLRNRKTSSGKKRSAAQSSLPSSRHFDVNNDGTLQLATLPGIQSFTDRALLSFLKSFAGMHRDEKLQNWKKDFRLGAGVGAFNVKIMYGMDAGWAVEGAVGSEYKIDATYLSPHVNMASRMMSATKQYGVTILLSQAVEELLSRPARSKLRHLDTVYVKGSSVEQRIYTYDARSQGVDFFLFERNPEQADMEAEAYSASIWEVDQDLRSMRQHVTDDFMTKFKRGMANYFAGNWQQAVDNLNDADNLMIQTVLEEGYIEYDHDELGSMIYDRRNSDEEIKRIRQEFGDGACKCLIQYMERRDCKAPDDWKGVRHLMSK
jgi:Adenylate and Guanylate cyclase catalytic domain